MARQRRSRLVGYTELRLNNYDNRARSRRQANSSGDSGWPATTAGIRMQGQANCPLDKPPDPGKQQRRLRRGGGYRPCKTNFRPQRSQCHNLMRYMFIIDNVMHAIAVQGSYKFSFSTPSSMTLHWLLGLVLPRTLLHRLQSQGTS